MGVAISTNTQGITNLNAFLSQKIGDEKIATTAGIFANKNFDGAPALRGVFGETSVYGHGFSISYAQMGSNGTSIHTGIRYNLYKDDFEAYDINVYGNQNNLMGGVFSVSRYGANLSWKTETGHSISIGASRSSPMDSITLEAGLRANLWKSESGASRVDISSNITQFIRGPLEGHQEMVAALTFSHSFG